jgi:ATP-dependent Clp protease ATP-binding subunit ClpC
MYTADVGIAGKPEALSASPQATRETVLEGSSDVVPSADAVNGSGRLLSPVAASATPLAVEIPAKSRKAAERDRLLVQIVGVSHRKDSRDHEELMYAPVPWDRGEAVPDPLFVRIRSAELQRHIDAVSAQVNELTHCALLGFPRGERGLEAAATELAHHALPPEGFVGLLSPGAHPQFNIIRDIASEIPWEVLEETYFLCPACRTPLNPHRQQSLEKPHCARCGRPMVRAGGKLALTYCISHLVTGQARPPDEGREFLIIEDPTGDLTSGKNDPHGICRSHLDELRGSLEKIGYEVNFLSGERATSQRVIKQLSRSTVVGVYYFGHGFVPKGGGDGCLVLADGPIHAGEIQDASPLARFVFLNACEGASSGRNWDLERRHISVAGAFARGGPWKVVIAPLWPVVNVQAAEMAREFFRAVSPVAGVGTALTLARRHSMERYASGEAHLGWGAYRLFGDPNRSLPSPSAVVPSIVVPERITETPLSRVFGSDHQLDEDVFSFALGEVLLRAAKRRNFQNRAQVSTADFCAGLVRKGSLTRLVLNRLGCDPDTVYGSFENRTDSGPAPVTSDDEPASASAVVESADGSGAQEIEESMAREVLAKWTIRDESDFITELVQILNVADRHARTRETCPDDRRISERDVLESLINAGAWSQETILPAASEAQRVLREIFAVSEVDANGQVSLLDLEPAAREIVEMAHMLAQQRGISPISHRLMLSAFFSNADGFAARALKRMSKEVQPELVFLLMVAASDGPAEETPSQSPRAFGLTMEACQRIVWPMLQVARQAAGGKLISEADLFRAFCVQADPGFKAALNQEPLSIDLDELVQPLEPTARKIIETAHELAEESGVPPPIPNRVLLAAFLRDPKGRAARACESQGIDAARFVAVLLRASGGTGRRKEFPLDENARVRAIDPMLARAEQLSPEQRINETTLLRAFCEVVPTELKYALKPFDLDSLAREITSAAPVGDERDKIGHQAISATTADHTRAAKRLPLDQRLFDEAAWAVIVDAGELAARQGWGAIRTPHLVAAAIMNGGPLAAALGQAGADPRALSEMILSTLPRGPGVLPTVDIRQLSDNAQTIVDVAKDIARHGGRSLVTRDDLTKALMASIRGPASQFFQGLDVRARLSDSDAEVEKPHTSDPSTLKMFGVDLTEKARSGHLPEIVGRDEEIETALQSLLLLENANPLLVGDSGVGKTAIVEGLAQRIVSGRCPAKLRSTRIIELSAGALVANTRYRGEFEQRIQQILAEASRDVVLFIDEIHALTGAGIAERGGPAAGDMLKAALARGEIRLIGATTHAEYKASIARDRALSRRFQLQIVRPPSREATMRVLSSRQTKLEEHHGVKVTDEARVAAVDLSGRHILDRQWPAKARDVLERACVMAVTEQPSGSSEEVIAVTREHVARVVAGITGVPLQRVSATDVSSLATLEDRLNRRIVGQAESIRTVVEAIRRGRQGLAAPDKPWGVFLFVGSPGVGKTELAKVLAEEVYGGSDGLIRFDMGDFTEAHSTARLIGAPPGYIGHEDGAPLVERLRRRPYSLLLFDEIEHAHENVLAVLLRLLSEGTLMDSEGNIADCRNSIVILTSNALDPERASLRVGFSRDDASVADASQSELKSLLETHFPRKLIDRLDAVVRFAVLGPTELESIALREAEEIVARVAQLYGSRVEAAPAALAWIARRATIESRGARDIRRAVEATLSGPLGSFLSRAQGQGKPTLSVDVRVVDDALVFEERTSA